MRSPIAMISYSSKDKEAAELLHDELALRCFEVIHDRYSFTDGSRIPSNMERGVEECDVFVGYLTPNSLYLDAEPGDPRPALEQELIPALERRRASLGSPEGERPIVILVSHGLGSRAETSRLVRERTGEPVDSLWSCWLDQETEGIKQREAADVATRALRAFVAADPPKRPKELFVTTRGGSPPPRRFTLDATRLLGGTRRPGSPEDWKRFLAALQAVEALVKAGSGGGAIRINLACHLLAALATGRVFHQATGWSPEFSTRHGLVTPSRGADQDRLTGSLDRYSGSGDLVIDIDLLGRDVAARTTDLIKGLQNIGGRLSLRRDKCDDLSPQQISELARSASQQIRSAHEKLRSAAIHVAMAAPAAFAGLLGYHLSALQAATIGYEQGHEGYVPVVTIPGTTP